MFTSPYATTPRLAAAETTYRSLQSDGASLTLAAMPSSSVKRTVLAVLPRSDSTTRKSDRTREAILSAALEFLWTHRFRDLTVGVLMEETGLSRSAFYKYFADAYDLIETLLRTLVADIFRETSLWFEGDGDPLELLRESVANLVRIACARGPILRAVSDAATSDPRLEKVWNEALAEFDKAIAARIRQHQNAGWITRFDPMPVAMALNRMNVAMLVDAFGHRPKKPQKPIAEALYRVWSSALYARGR